MMYEIYINKPTKQATLHLNTCGKIHQHGKETTLNGTYIKVLSLDKAKEKLEEHKLQNYKVKYCSFCMSDI